MSISSKRISYAVGNAAWDSKAAQEGIPVLEHFEPELVTDAASSPVLARDAALPDGDSFNIGSKYYVCQPPVLFSPAHAILFLDKLFESTSVGVPVNYIRYYEAEHIDSEPSSPYINLWKRTAKVGHDHNLCLYNGLVTGISITKEPGAPLILSPRLAFGARSFSEADPAAWDINRTDGNTDPVLDGDLTFYVFTPGGAPATFKITHFNVDLSCEFTPHFWGSQNPDRFSRGRKALSGSLTLRDITDQVENFSSCLEGSTTKTIWILMGNSTLYLNVNLHAGGGGEDEITRHGKFNFTGVYEQDAAYPTGFKFYVKAGRAYTP